MTQGAIITIDTNDRLQVGNLQWPGALTRFESLPAGDLKAVCPDGCTLLVERKTPRDFLDSIKDGRLFNQVEGLVCGADFAYLIITGTFTEHRGKVIIDGGEMTGWQWSAIQGALMSIQELGCTIVYDADYHDCVRRLINRSRGSIKVAPRREAYIFSDAENVLMSLPGIGSKHAVKILEIFGGHVGMALQWLSDPSEFEPRIDGVGTKTKERINQLFGGKLELKL